MRLYFAGNTIGPADCQIVYNAGARNKLLTYAEIDDWSVHAFDYWVYNKPHDATIFMDCGAFSALSRGAVIDFRAYMDFAHKWGHNIAELVQLDKVGDWQQTRKNLEIMEADGLTPIPVYTAAAPLSELERLCERYKHIALGGLRGKVAGSNPWRRAQMDKTFKIAEKYWPVKFHAFGITSQWALERYPLYSADSSSAIVGAGMGRVMTFERGVIKSEPWVPYAKRTLNGEVVDHIGQIGTTGTRSAHWGRRTHNIREFVKFEDYLTRLWTSRGIVW